MYMQMPKILKGYYTTGCIIKKPMTMVIRHIRDVL